MLEQLKKPLYFVTAAVLLTVAAAGFGALVIGAIF